MEVLPDKVKGRRDGLWNTGGAGRGGAGGSESRMNGAGWGRGGSNATHPAAATLPQPKLQGHPPRRLT